MTFIIIRRFVFIGLFAQTDFVDHLSPILTKTFVRFKLTIVIRFKLITYFPFSIDVSLTIPTHYYNDAYNAIKGTMMVCCCHQ